MPRVSTEASAKASVIHSQEITFEGGWIQEMDLNPKADAGRKSAEKTQGDRRRRPAMNTYLNVVALISSSLSIIGTLLVMVRFLCTPRKLRAFSEELVATLALLDFLASVCWVQASACV